jgi:hypothetical protein
MLLPLRRPRATRPLVWETILPVGNRGSNMPLCIMTCPALTIAHALDPITVFDPLGKTICP